MRSTFAITLSFVALSLALPAAFAQTTTAAPAAATTAAAAPPATGVSKVAIIDIQKAIVNTNEGRRDFEALQKKFDPKQAELKAQSDEVDRLKKELSSQTDKLSEDERAKRVQVIETKQKALQRTMEDAQNDYQQQSNEIANRIGGKMIQLLDSFAKKNGIGVVMDVSGQNNNVLWGSEQSNVTAEIVTAYNAQSGIAAPTPSAPRPQSGARTTPRPLAKPATTTPK